MPAKLTAVKLKFGNISKIEIRQHLPSERKHRHGVIEYCLMASIKVRWKANFLHRIHSFKKSHKCVHSVDAFQFLSVGLSVSIALSPNTLILTPRIALSSIVRIALSHVMPNPPKWVFVYWVEDVNWSIHSADCVIKQEMLYNLDMVGFVEYHAGKKPADGWPKYQGRILAVGSKF